MTQHRDRAGGWRREQLKKGASPIKIGVGVGVIADLEPIDSIQFTPEGMQPADILLLDGDPTQVAAVLQDCEKNFAERGS